MKLQPNVLVLFRTASWKFALYFSSALLVSGPFKACFTFEYRQACNKTSAARKPLYDPVMAVQQILKPVVCFCKHYVVV